jgi:hypothetical protein
MYCLNLQSSLTVLSVRYRLTVYKYLRMYEVTNTLFTDYQNT